MWISALGKGVLYVDNRSWEGGCMWISTLGEGGYCKFWVPVHMKFTKEISVENIKYYS